MRWVAVLFAVVLAGCSSTRTVTIRAQPPDATLKIDGQVVGTGTVQHDIVFNGANDAHTITASRPGYEDGSIKLTADDPRTQIDLNLSPFSRHVRFIVSPVPGIVSINGKPLSTEPVERITADLTFTLDASNRWTSYSVTAARTGFDQAKATVTYTDRTSDYALVLPSLRKDVTISTTPPGASVSVDGDNLSGASPVVDKDVPFAFDTASGQFIPHKVTISKPGYDPIDRSISWDDGKTDYSIDLIPKSKPVRITTDPPGGVVMVDGHELSRDDAGVSSGTLAFPPTDDRGTLRVYTATVNKKTADSEWEPATLAIGWDGGHRDYAVSLKEIKTRPVAELAINIERNLDGVWEIVPRQQVTIARKDVAEGGGRGTPVQVVQADRGTTIHTLAMSPDGTQLIFTELAGSDKSDLRSQILAVKPDGSGGIQQLTDGKALDLFPAFTPAGDQIVFSSNRAGKKLSVWEKSAIGAPGTAQLTMGDEQDIWPGVDADPHPRLFYETLMDDRPEPRLYMTQIGRTIRTELSTLPVTQPRVSPKADSIVFSAVNPKTGKRDIFLIPDQGGVAVNLTNATDFDNFDPAWSKDGSRLAYVSDRGVDEDRRNNRDIWVMDVAHPERPVQITTNGSVDDAPVWDPDGTTIYFRSNRGGAWGIWKIEAK